MAAGLGLVLSGGAAQAATTWSTAGNFNVISGGTPGNGSIGQQTGATTSQCNGWTTQSQQLACYGNVFQFTSTSGNVPLNAGSFYVTNSATTNPTLGGPAC